MKCQKTARQIFSSNLRNYREAKQISQESLAHLAGLHRTYVGSVERCERNISIDNMEKLAQALNIHLSDMLIDPHEKSS